MKLGIIGGGNMAAAMIGGLRERGGEDLELRVVERDAGRRELLEREHGVAAQEFIDETLQDAQIIVLAVKPGDVRAVCEELCARVAPGQSGTLLVSIAAGIPTEAIARWSLTQSVVRAMPNTPALIGQGVTGLYARPGVSEAQRSAATRVLAVLGDAFWMDDEGQLDAITAVSGSGPAYVFYFIEALQQAGCRMGLKPELAHHLAVQTFVGAAQLASRSGEPLDSLRERVTSKGGTTAAALARMQQAHVSEAIIEAAFAALERSREMARTLDG
jgi:pyrroline-5-carboxylate reductase